MADSAPRPTQACVIEQIKRHRLTIVAVVVLALVATTLDVLTPLLFRFLIDRAIPARDPTQIATILLGMVALPLVASVLNFLEGRQRTQIGTSVTTALRQQALDHLLSARLLDLERGDTRTLFQRITRSCGKIGELFIADNLLPLIPRVIVLLGNIVAMIYASWRLALVTMVAVPLLFVFGQAFRKRVEQVDEPFIATIEAGAAMVQEILDGLRTIRAVNGQPREAERWRRWNEDYQRTLLASRALHEFWVANLSLLITNLVLAVVLGFGAFEIMDGRLTVGGLVAFVVYAPRALSAMQQLSRTQLSLATMRIEVAKLDELFAMPQERAGGDPLPMTIHRERGVAVAFDGVSFRYGRGDSGVSNLSFHINPGEFVGIVGPTGGGKSTFFDLLCGFYEPDSGRILIDDVALDQLSLASVRDAMGIVAQEPFLWNASLLDNLIYPRAASEEDAEVQAAVGSAQLASFVAALPDGLQTKVGESGNALSGGERQRIAIARAVLRRPRLLLLDEATSALDALTEQRLRDSLDSLRVGRTTIVIAHRLATIVHADRILVIDNGRLVEQGSPDELLKQQGLFHAFYQAQRLDRRHQGNEERAIKN